MSPPARVPRILILLPSRHTRAHQSSLGLVAAPRNVESRCAGGASRVQYVVQRARCKLKISETYSSPILLIGPFVTSACCATQGNANPPSLQVVRHLAITVRHLALMTHTLRSTAPNSLALATRRPSPPTLTAAHALEPADSPTHLSPPVCRTPHSPGSRLRARAHWSTQRLQ
ncbi:hypothetical protein C8R45DRAFT_1022695 [Mycena sanguinolenta]|nr:hypothetical protein C8R45DRAFT_1022695 [Mycena sanguinolenta]